MAFSITRMEYMSILGVTTRNGKYSGICLAPVLPPEALGRESVRAGVNAGMC
jgi:hypothetical protein